MQRLQKLKQITLFQASVHFLILLVHFSYANDFSSSIVIAFREDRQGSGAYFDHYCIQNCTQHPTTIEETYIEEQPAFHYNYINEYLSHQSLTLPQTVTLAPLSYEEGLLYIPGRMPGTEDDFMRNCVENKLIKNALLRGQPILGVCAGCWQLWKFFGGSLVPITNHLNSQMIRLQRAISSDIMHVINNGETDQIHTLEINEDSLVGIIIQGHSTATHIPLRVNSIHSSAMDMPTLPAELKLSAWADDLPEGPSIEAIETHFGAPMIGTQWHIEAYFQTENNPYTPIVIYMAKAGDTYKQKRACLRQLLTQTPLRYAAS